MNQIYPQAKRNGGRLITRVILLLREQGIKLPLDRLILTDSGGSDSHALTHLIVKHGRRIVKKENIEVVHINHGWRGTESDKDEEFVRLYCEKSGVKFTRYQLTKPTTKELKNESPENLARLERKRIFNELTVNGGFVFTAHHADDNLETMLWRLCSGKLETHGSGILFKTGKEIRPFITSKKEELRDFLKEESEEWREDATNAEGLLLRSRMRKELIPELLKIFPQAVDNVLKETIKRQARKAVEEDVS